MPQEKKIYSHEVLWINILLRIDFLSDENLTQFQLQKQDGFYLEPGHPWQTRHEELNTRGS